MNKNILIKELEFTATTSSGPGGQHVNKVASQVELRFDLNHSKGLSEKEKSYIQEKVANRLTKDGFLLLRSGESRSQHKNKTLVINRFFELIEKSLQRPKKRKKTKPSKSAIEKRIQAKKKQALKKQQRKPPQV